MIAAGSVISKKKLTIKFPSQRIEAVPGTRSCAFGEQLAHDNKSDQNKLQHVKEKSVVPCSKKRGLLDVINPQSAKRQRMDRISTQHCSILLKSLMGHPAGWVFNQPVDPVALNIPDYFSIISKPMDLGTVKSKLQKNQYAGVDEFAADIRLTFANAKLYNPPTNNVHKMAQELLDIFEARLKSLEEKCIRERTKCGSGKLSNGQKDEISEAKHSGPTTPPLRIAVVSKKSNPFGEKAVKSSSCARVGDTKPAKPAGNRVTKLLEQNFHKGCHGGGGHASDSVGVKPLLKPIAVKCGQCGKHECQCGVPSDSTRAISDISSERSSGRDHRTCSTDSSKLHCQPKSATASEITKSDPDSDGAVSALDDENTCPSSQLTIPATDAASGEGWEPIFDVQLSPSKALRAAIVKRRFADTILKAQQKTLLDQGDKSDPVKMQQEKERLERRQREEKARIEAQIRAAEAASRRKEEIEMKKQRDREREAARIALQKMEKTAEIEQNLEILRELEGLCGCSLSYDLHVYCGEASVRTGGTYFGSPLERLGLFMKRDDDIDQDEDEALNFDGEEGEILS